MLVVRYLSMVCVFLVVETVVLSILFPFPTVHHYREISTHADVDADIDTDPQKRS